MKNADMPATPTSITVHEKHPFGGTVPAVLKCDGLTKRETIAMHTLQGLLCANIPGPDDTVETVANTAVVYADALLAELAKPSA